RLFNSIYEIVVYYFFFFFSSRRRHTRCLSDWSSDVCSSDLDQDCQMIELPRPMRAGSSFLLLLFAFGCARDSQSDHVTDSQRKAIAADVEQAMREAYDLSKPNVADRMLSLYPTSGRIISATGGRVLSSRDSLE